MTWKPSLIVLKRNMSNFLEQIEKQEGLEKNYQFLMAEDVVLYQVAFLVSIYTVTRVANRLVYKKFVWVLLQKLLIPYHSDLSL